MPTSASAPARLSSPAAAWDGAVGSPHLARAAGWIRTGPCWRNQHHLQLFLAFLSQFLQIWGRVGAQSSPPYLNQRCSCKSCTSPGASCCPIFLHAFLHEVHEWAALAWLSWMSFSWRWTPPRPGFARGAVSPGCPPHLLCSSGVRDLGLHFQSQGVQRAGGFVDTSLSP